MNNELEHKVIVVVGIFILSCVAATFFYGIYPVIICIIGLFVIAAILQLFRGGTGGR